MSCKVGNIPVRSKGNFNFLNSQRQSMYPQMSSSWTTGGFPWLDKSQHASGTGETGSRLPKGVFPFHLAKGTNGSPWTYACGAYQHVQPPGSSSSYSQVPVLHCKGFTPVSWPFPLPSYTPFLLHFYSHCVFSIFYPVILPSLTDSPGQSAIHVQSTALSLCSGLLQVPLAVFSLLSTLKPSHTMDPSCQFIHLVPKPSYISSAKHLGEAQMEPLSWGLTSVHQIELVI